MESEATSITIGGALRESDVQRFLDAVQSDVALLDWNEELPADAADLIGQADMHGGSLRLFNADKAWGKFQRIEALCQELALWYVRQNESVMVWWGPAMALPSWTHHVDGDPVVGVAQVRFALDGPAPASALRTLIENRTPTAVPVFRIVED